MSMVSSSAHKGKQEVRRRGLPFITFRMGKELYGFPIEHVKEVVRNLPITRVPRSPDYMCGVINLRGGVVTVVDLANRFGLSPVANPDTAYVIVVEVAHEDAVYLVGLRVDQVQEVVRIQPDELDASPRIGGLVASEYVSGIFLREEGFVTVLNLAKAFDIAELLKRSAEAGTAESP